MSAFVVSNDHIDALLSFAKDKHMQAQLSHFVDPIAPKPLDWTRIGQVLLAENERSVCHRYPDAVPGSAPGSAPGVDAIDYRFRYFEPFIQMDYQKKCTWVIKGCQCFDYQACENDDYDESIANRIIRAIRGRAIAGLSDYDDAPWEIHRTRMDRKPVVVTPPRRRRGKP